MTYSPSRSKTILLLTATIAPRPGVPLLSRTDARQRRPDYLRALSFYLPLLGSTFDGIVFAENSCSDLTDLRALAEAAGHARRVEFLSIDGLDHPPAYGRGFSEFKLVDQAMAGASLLQGDVCVWKCTGRYMVLNLEAMVRDRPACAIYLNCRNLPRRLCDLYLMSFTRAGHASMIEGIYRVLRNDGGQGHVGEEVLFRRCADRWPGPPTVVRRFAAPPMLSGTRGWNNVPYDDGKSVKSLVRRWAQRWTPWLWI